MFLKILFWSVEFIGWIRGDNVKIRVYFMVNIWIVVGFVNREKGYNLKFGGEELIGFDYGLRGIRERRGLDFMYLVWVIK